MKGNVFYHKLFFTSRLSPPVAVENFFCSLRNKFTAVHAKCQLVSIVKILPSVFAVSAKLKIASIRAFLMHLTAPTRRHSQRGTIRLTLALSPHVLANFHFASFVIFSVRLFLRHWLALPRSRHSGAIAWLLSAIYRDRNFLKLIWLGI